VLLAEWLKNWHNTDQAGDCRYWPASAWLMCGHGSEHLKQFPVQRPLQEERGKEKKEEEGGKGEGKFPVQRDHYIHNLDIYCLGVTCCQLFVNCVDKTSPELQELAAWQHWTTATELWKPIYDTRRRGSVEDFSNVKQWRKEEKGRRKEEN